jgi:hypothetical protein
MPGTRLHRIPVFALLTLACCQPPAAELPPRDTDDTGPARPTESRDTGIETIPDGPDVPTGAELSAWIFTLDRVHEVEIELSRESWDALAAWPDEYTWEVPFDYVEGDITIDGELVEQVGVRIKGQQGSYRPLEGKPSLKIDINLYRDQEYYGLKKLTFNNMILDYPGVQEHMGYLIYNALGIPAPRTTYAHITINDLDYGLYNWIENYDGTFTKDRLLGGNLYEADYVIYEDGGYTMVDFRPERDLFEFKAGDDVGLEDIHSVTQALLDYEGHEDFYEQTGQVVDWTDHHRFWAIEWWIGHTDGYVNNSNNYYAWFDPDGGRVRLLAWDMAYTFLHTFSAKNAVGALAAACLADEACHADLLVQVDQVCDEIDALDLDGELERSMALINEAYLADPRRETQTTTIHYYQEVMPDWFAERSNYAHRTWGLD